MQVDYLCGLSKRFDCEIFLAVFGKYGKILEMKLLAISAALIALALQSSDVCANVHLILLWLLGPIN